MISQHIINLKTQGRSTQNISHEISQIVLLSGIKTGLCHVFIHHTSASLIITENADPNVRRDLEFYMQKTVIDDDPGFLHKDEGPDDMSAHIRTVLTQTELTIPVTNSQLGLGTWQGIFCWEHRAHPHQRQITVTIQGK